MRSSTKRHAPAAHPVFRDAWQARQYLPWLILLACVYEFLNNIESLGAMPGLFLGLNTHCTNEAAHAVTQMLRFGKQ
jgi:hypothetical protein